MGHLCVKSSGQIFATLGFDEHIGSHFSGFFAGLHSEDRAMSEKMPKMSGQRVRPRSFMPDSKITELVVTAKYMKRGGARGTGVSSSSTSNTCSGSSRSSSHSTHSMYNSSNTSRG